MRRSSRRLYNILLIVLSITIATLAYSLNYVTGVIKDADSRLLKLESVVSELNNETYTVREFENQIYYDIPLSEELQEYTFIQCVKYDVDPVLALAVMKTESGFKCDSVSATDDYGMMQINIGNHKWLSDEFNGVNLLDAEDNIKCGVYMLSRIKQSDPQKKLMVYNMGGMQAKALWNDGVYSTKYTDKVISNMEYIKEREVIK